MVQWYNGTKRLHKVLVSSPPNPNPNPNPNSNPNPNPNPKHRQALLHAVRVNSPDITNEINALREVNNS